MIGLLNLVGQAVALYISTDLDDVFVLLGFFADPRFRVRQIAAGQLIGIATLYASSVAGSWLSYVVPTAVLGLLGAVPILMGLRGAWDAWFRSGPGEQEPISPDQAPSKRSNTAAVIAMTIANGSDNVSVYIPYFATRSRIEVVITGIVFVIMTGLWLYLAYWLTRHRAMGVPVRHYTRLSMPMVFIALGIFILYRAGTVEWLQTRIMSF